MAKQRIVNTRFWIDDYISNLDPIEKLMFLYFLTSPSTDICGVYEIPLKTVATDTGIEIEMVKKILRRFSRDKKIYYVDGWVGIKNFAKHQTINPKVQEGIKNGLSKAPKVILDKLSEPMDSLSHLNSNSNLNLNSNLNNTSNVPLPEDKKEINKEIGEVIDRFSLLNDNYKKFFGNTTQRKAASELIESYRMEKVIKAIYMAKFCITDSFFPNFTTPYELQMKWPKVKRYFATKNAKDKRWIEEFDKYVNEMERERNKDIPKEVVTTNIAGRKVTYEINRN